MPAETVLFEPRWSERKTPRLSGARRAIELIMLAAAFHELAELSTAAVASVPSRVIREALV